MENLSYEELSEKLHYEFCMMLCNNYIEELDVEIDKNRTNILSLLDHTLVLECKFIEDLIDHDFLISYNKYIKSLIKDLQK